MSMTTAEGIAAIRSMIGAPSAVAVSDGEIEGWLDVAARDVSAKTLGCRERYGPIPVPAHEFTGKANLLAPVALSGTPRVCVASDGSTTFYYKVYPTKAGTETPTTEPSGWKTYEDRTLSGTAQYLGLSLAGQAWWVIGYPDVVHASPAEEAAWPGTATGDDVQSLLYPCADPVFVDLLSESGSIITDEEENHLAAESTAVFRILSGGSYCYFSAYQGLLGTFGQCDEQVTLPVPTGTLKVFSVHKEDDAGNSESLVCIHPRLVGHAAGMEAGASRFFWEFGNVLGLAPGGAGNGFTVCLHRAALVDRFCLLPEEIQPAALYYAYTMACYKEGKFRRGAMALQAYLPYVAQARRWVYEMWRDGRGDFAIPDGRLVVRRARK